MTRLEQLMAELPQNVQDMIHEKYKGEEENAAFVASVVNNINRVMTDTVKALLDEQTAKLDSMENNIQWLMRQFTTVDKEVGIMAQIQDDVTKLRNDMAEVKELLKK